MLINPVTWQKASQLNKIENKVIARLRPGILFFLKYGRYVEKRPNFPYPYLTKECYFAKLIVYVKAKKRLSSFRLQRAGRVEAGKEMKAPWSRG